MPSVIAAYENALETFGTEAFGELVEGETHAASIIGSQGEYIELGYFKNGSGRGRPNYALTRVPTNARNRYDRDIIIGHENGAVSYREDSYDYIEWGLDDAPQVTQHRSLAPADEQAAVAQFLDGSVVLKHDAALSLQRIFRDVYRLHTYWNSCWEARQDRSRHVGAITTQLLTGWNSGQA